MMLIEDVFLIENTYYDIDGDIKLIDNEMQPSKHIAFALDPKLPNKPFITQGKSNARNGLPFPRNPPY